MKKKQAVCRTYNQEYTIKTANLQDYLTDGWTVVLATKMNDYIEYIIEKEVDDETKM